MTLRERVHEHLFRGYRERRQATVYALCEPESGRPRYIGQTETSLKERLQRHIRTAHGSYGDQPVHAWIRELNASGQRPVIRKLATYYNSAPLGLKVESVFIQHYHALYSDLLNRDKATRVRMTTRRPPAQ